MIVTINYIAAESRIAVSTDTEKPDIALVIGIIESARALLRAQIIAPLVKKRAVKTRKAAK